ncbi:class I SAM-dependent methyltransferase [Dyella sp. 2HG41-7]|uniref:class I SAM-dependent methyltransferase n=1 Tax=Dyella sp. 2HG41-7 TaxID=2883239 RepID=UPI001F285C99|nr:class I SAM-dependent methyltransferase [Dyella sp. 2HG41-7]
MDIGAADCWVESLLPAGVEYVALDYPSTGRDLYGGTPHVFADGACLPFPNECFDGVACLEVLEHVPDPMAVMTEIERVLKPAGRAWISMPFLYPLHDLPFDFQRYTEQGLMRIASRCGLQVVSIQRRNHAIDTAGLLLCLAIAGGIYAQRRIWRACLLPFAAMMVLFTNLATWVLARIWPDWTHVATGYAMEVRKP